MTDKELEQMRINSTRIGLTTNSAYKAGLLDMQDKMLDKACEWLKDNGYLATNGWYTIKGTLEDFREAMEKQS